jgi:hypothetical protein
MHRIPVALLLALVASPALAAPALAATVRLAPHRAVYDLSLAESRGTRAVEGARGRIVFDFTGDDCKGWALQYRQVTVLESGETGAKTSDLRNTTFESGDGRTFTFRTQSDLNGAAGERVDGEAERTGDGVKIQVKRPKPETATTSGTVYFPSDHMRRLVEAARAGQTTLEVKVFDGSEDGRKVYDTLAIIGRPEPTGDAAKAEAPLKQGPMAEMPRWPVVLSYFQPGQGERVPVYTLAFDLYENGVSGRLRLDYNDFSLKGDLSRFELLPESTSCKP